MSDQTQSAPAAAPLPEAPRLAMVFIVLTLVIDAIGIGIMIPVLPDLIIELADVSVSSAAAWNGWLLAIFALMQFIFQPVLGSLSDTYGRRPVLLFSLLIVAIDFVLMGLAHAMWFLVLTRIIGGIATSTQSTATAFIADISKPEDKAANFGILGAAFGIGFILGPVLGGALLGFGVRTPFFAAAGLAALNLILGYFVLPETVTDRIRRPFEWRRANPFGAFKNISKLPGIVPFLVLFFIYEFAFIVYPTVWPYYTREQFGWDGAMVGYSLGFFGIFMAISQGFLIRIIMPKLGEIKTFIMGVALNFIVFVILAFITNGIIALLFTPLSALGAMAFPALQGLLSRMAGDDQQGELQGLIASIISVAMIIAPLILGTLFEWATLPENGIDLPGAPFILAAVLNFVCLVMILIIVRRRA